MNDFKRYFTKFVEGANLDGLIGPSGVIKVLQIRDEVLSKTEQYARKNNLVNENGRAQVSDNEADAFRHTYLNIKLAQEFGPETAKQITSMHEHVTGTSASQAGARHMDFHNNKVGLELAFNKNFINHTPEQITEIAIEKGLLITDATHVVPDAVWDKKVRLQEAQDNDAKESEDQTIKEVTASDDTNESESSTIEVDGDMNIDM